MEAYHATLYRVLPRTQMPIFLAVQMFYNAAKNYERTAKGICDGRTKQKRKRGEQHKKKKLPLDLFRNEWTSTRPETARAIAARCRAIVAAARDK